MSEPLKYKYFAVLPSTAKRHIVITLATGTVLGVIQYHPPWRQYVLAPSSMTVWSDGCLKDIQDAIAKIKAGAAR